MTIKIGDKIPDISLKILTETGMEDISTAALFAGKTAVLFSVPGAFTPTCSAKHLPGFVTHAAEFKAKGIDLLVCLAVNDPFVMKAWAATQNIGDSVMMLPDGNGTFTTALGLTLDASGHGLGTRGQRFALLIEDGTVKSVQIEAPGAFVVSSAEAMLALV
jgi:glutaredoxin/glutathione-dependent peroxiredoxin